MLHIRLKEELARLGLKPAAAARAAGEQDSQGLRDVLGGRKRLSAELLAGLASTGVDVFYVLTGKHVLTADEREFLALFRAAPLAGKAAAIGALQGVAAATPVQKRVKVTAQGGNAAGRDMVVKNVKRG